MKKFLLLVSKIAVLIIFLAVVLDLIYTAIYQFSAARGKVEVVYNGAPQNYDVVILGSSRANNHFVPALFEARGLHTFNFGMSGSHLFEADLLLQLMLERQYKIKTVLLEVDLSLSNEQRADGISAKFLPYIHQSEPIREHFEQEPDFMALYYIPFYRYLKFDGKIGFREGFKTATQEPTRLLDNAGYYPLDNKKKRKMTNNIVNLNPLPHNKYYENIKKICAQNNIQLIAIMTPMCENTKGLNYFDKVKKAYPEIHNYENAVVEDHYFSSCGHLNDAGATKFTQVVINDFFRK